LTETVVTVKVWFHPADATSRRSNKDSGIRRLVEVPRGQTVAAQEDGRMIDVTGVKVFSATKAKERELLGELITDWIRSHPDHEIVDKIVTQSSDSEFHCLTITLFYKQNKA
jgi:hypothetical protein